jgi:hypothetical protein
MLDSPAGTLSAEAAARQLETATIQKQKNLLERRFIAWCDDRGFRQGCLERCWQGRVIGTGAVSERPALSGCADQGPERGLEVRQVWRQRRSAVLEWLRGQCRHAIRAGRSRPRWLAAAGSRRRPARGTGPVPADADAAIPPPKNRSRSSACQAGCCLLGDEGGAAQYEQPSDDAARVTHERVSRTRDQWQAVRRAGGQWR